MNDHVPNFLVIGAAKAGTTSIWQYLRQHPQVYMHPEKRLNFFSYQGNPHFNGPPPGKINHCEVRDINAYIEQFRLGAGKLAIGECSNSYIYVSEAAERIHDHLPNAKLIAILRHPAERAYSRYLMLLQDGRETEFDFRRALNAETARVRENWWPEFHYLRAGLYHAQLKPYVEKFDKQQIKIVLYEDLTTDPVRTMSSIFKFLEVDPTFTPNMSVRYSVTGIPRSRTVHQIMKGMRGLRPIIDPHLSETQRVRVSTMVAKLKERNLIRPQLDLEIRNELISRYREDVLSLQDMISRDLSAWLS